MLFHTPEFAIFFAVLFVLYASFTRRAQNALLLAGSYFFYGWWDWRFLGLLALSTIVDYTAGRLMPRAGRRGRRALLVASLGTNLGILGVFKYFDFFADSAASLLASIGFQADTPTLQVLLPVGISFYTFQTLAYTIDVYRGKVEPTKDPLAFALYVAYFPQLVAGPIERAQRLLPQFARDRVVTGERLASGAVLVLIGLVRKLVIADGVAPIVDAAFASPDATSGAGLLLAVFLFGVQIYGDFAGYSDMARGISRMLGIDLMENFRHPYFATNITEFWRRWHVSLSTWLRDYLYIPLGGNRGSRFRTGRNVMVTMLLGGLWHGASWTFVVWGGIHGGALLIHKAWLRGRAVPDRAPVRGIGDLARASGGWLLTMGVVGLAWVFFRAPDFGAAFEVLGGIASGRGGGVPAEWTARAVIVAAALLLIDVPQYVGRNPVTIVRWPAIARGMVYAVWVLLIVLARGDGANPFLYFQF